MKSEYLKLFDASHPTNFRKYMRSVGLRGLVDNVNNGIITDEKEIEKIEHLVRRDLGNVYIMNMIDNYLNNNIEVVDNESYLDSIVAPKPIKAKEVVEPEVVEPEVIEPEIVEPETVAVPTKPVYVLKLAYGTKAMQSMGTMEGEGDYEEGCEATLTANANEGYEFTGWKTAGTSEQITDNPITVTVDSDKTYKAYFKKNANE